MWGLGAVANSTIQYATTGEINPINSVAAGWINVITIGQGWTGTIAWNEMQSMETTLLPGL